MELIPTPAHQQALLPPIASLVAPPATTANLRYALRKCEGRDIVGVDYQENDPSSQQPKEMASASTLQKSNHSFCLPINSRSCSSAADLYERREAQYHRMSVIYRTGIWWILLL